MDWCPLLCQIYFRAWLRARKCVYVCVKFPEATIYKFFVKLGNRQTTLSFYSLLIQWHWNLSLLIHWYWNFSLLALKLFTDAGVSLYWCTDTLLILKRLFTGTKTLMILKLLFTGNEVLLTLKLFLLTQELLFTDTLILKLLIGTETFLLRKLL